MFTPLDSNLNKQIDMLVYQGSNFNFSKNDYKKLTISGTATSINLYKYSAISHGTATLIKSYVVGSEVDLSSIDEPYIGGTINGSSGQYIILKLE